MTEGASATPVALDQTSARKFPFHFSVLDIALIIVTGIWGSNFVVSKVATDTLPPLAYNALRFPLAALWMYILMRILHVDLTLPRREWWPIILCSIVGHLLYQPLFINGIHLTDASNSVLIITAGPVWVVLFNAYRSQERITRGSFLGVVLALFGVVVVIVGRYAGQFTIDNRTLLGDAFMVIASVMWAGSILTSRGPLMRNPHLVATFWMLVCGAVTQSILGLPWVLTMDWKTFTAPVALAVVYSGVISIVGGSIVFNYGINKLGTARASLYTYIQPLVAAGLGVILLGEPFSASLVIGGLLIFVGVSFARRM